MYLCIYVFTFLKRLSRFVLHLYAVQYNILYIANIHIFCIVRTQLVSAVSCFNDEMLYIVHAHKTEMLVEVIIHLMSM